MPNAYGNISNGALLSGQPTPDTGSSASKWVATAGGCSVGGVSCSTASSTAYYSGPAIALDGTSYVTFGTATAFGGAPISISVWFKYTAGTGRVFDFQTAANSNAGFLLAVNTGIIYLAIANTNGATLSPPTLSLGTWYHFVLAYSPGATTYYYVNGVRYTFSGTPNTGQQTWSYVSGLGRSSWSEATLNGLVGDFRFFSRALTAADVTALYSGVACTPQPFPPSPPPPSPPPPSPRPPSPPPPRCVARKSNGANPTGLGGCKAARRAQP